jgi:hypothetical protein
VKIESADEFGVGKKRNRTILGSARVSRAGDSESFRESQTFQLCGNSPQGANRGGKFVAAECSDQHAESVRSPIHLPARNMRRKLLV